MTQQDENYYFDDEGQEESPEEAPPSQPSPNRLQQQAELDKQRYEASLQKPESNAKLVDEIANRVVGSITQAQQQTQQQEILQEYAQRYPDLASNADYVTVAIERERREAESRGEAVDFRTMLDRGIERFAKETGKPLASTNVAQSIRNSAFSHDTGKASPQPQQTELQSALDSDFTDFAKVWDARKATQY
jgi:hypothetical protein